MEPLFEGLTASEIEYLKYLQQHGYFDGLEMYLKEDTSSDYRVEKFEQNGYIVLKDDGPYDGALFIEVTGKGIAALVDYDKFCKKSFKSSRLNFLKWLIPLCVTITSVVIAYLQLLK